MSEDPGDSRARWNVRWREKTDEAWEPDPWLVRTRPLLPAGKALDLACGRGANALFLASEGWTVTAVDVSDEAIGQLRRKADQCRLEVEALRMDLEKNPDLPPQAFDLVIQMYYLHRPLLPLLKRTVKPGGMAVIRTFSSAGPFPAPTIDDRFVLRTGELSRAFSDWEIMLDEEGVEPSRKGGSLAGIVARKPD